MFTQVYQKTRDVFGPMWKSLCEPAQLPLTADFPPRERELERSHDLSNYDVLQPPSMEDKGVAEGETRILERMQSQRVSQNFQLCTTSNPLANNRTSVSLMDPTEDTNAVSWLSFGRVSSRYALVVTPSRGSHRMVCGTDCS